MFNEWSIQCINVFAHVWFLRYLKNLHEVILSVMCPVERTATWTYEMCANFAGEQRFSVEPVRSGCSCKAAVSDSQRMAGVKLTLPVCLHENKLTWSPESNCPRNLKVPPGHNCFLSPGRDWANKSRACLRPLSKLSLQFTAVKLLARISIRLVALGRVFQRSAKRAHAPSPLLS